MSDNKPDPKDCYFYIKALLECGAVVEIMQRDKTVPWEIIVTPKQGTDIKDFSREFEGTLRINIQPGSVIGLYQLLGLILNPPKRKKLFGLF
jgi:hypothetical protein